MNVAGIKNVAIAVRPDGTYEPFSIEAWQYVGQMIKQLNLKTKGENE